jgi:hypothetical protein
MNTYTLVSMACGILNSGIAAGQGDWTEFLWSLVAAGWAYLYYDACKERA